MQRVDIVIVGAGMAGATLALALSRLNYNILLIDRHPPQAPVQPSFDDRSIALSRASMAIMDYLGLWQLVKEQCQAIEHIHVSDRGHLGISRLHATDFNETELGCVIENRVLGVCLQQQLTAATAIQVKAPAQILQIQPQSNLLHYACDGDNFEVEYKVLVAADGGQSQVRQLLNIDTQQKDYQTTALIANVTTEVAHNNWAYERFTEDGPLALLPMTQQRLSLVWSLQPDAAARLLDCSEQQFIKQLQSAFGFRLGHFQQVGQRACYPLSLITTAAHQYAKVAFIANAAQSIHPIAGQGFNLGLRDIIGLYDLLKQQGLEDCDLSLFQQLRQQDRQQTIGLTDGLLSLFANRYPLLTEARNIALNLLDICPIAKQQLAQQFMGYQSHLPDYVWEHA